VSVGYQLLTVPLFLTFWSTGLYGEWLVLSALPGYIALSNLGLMNVAGNNMTMAMGAGDLQEARESLHTVWGSQLLINAIASLLLVGGLLSVDVASLLRLRLVDGESAKVAVFVMCLYAMLNLQAGVFGGIYRAVGQNARGVFVGNTIRLLSVIVMGGGLLIGVKSVVSVSLLLAGSYTLGAIFLFVDTRRIAPDLRPGLTAFCWSRLKIDIRDGLAFMAYPLGRACTNQGMLLFTNTFLSSSAVVVLATLRTLVNTIFQASNIINLSTWPEFSRLHGEKKWREQQRLFCRSTTAGIWAGMLGAFIMIMLGPYLLFWWTRGEVVVDRGLLGLYLLPIVFNSGWYTASSVFNAVNRHHKVSACFLLSSITVPVVAWFVHIMMGGGLFAVGAGFAVMETIMLLYVFPNALRLVLISAVDWGKEFVCFPKNAVQIVICASRVLRKACS
jgi:O-antigen/teichoic acid export membrane protein